MLISFSYQLAPLWFLRSPSKETILNLFKDKDFINAITTLRLSRDLMPNETFFISRICNQMTGSKSQIFIIKCSDYPKVITRFKNILFNKEFIKEDLIQGFHFERLADYIRLYWTVNNRHEKYGLLTTEDLFKKYFFHLRNEITHLSTDDYALKLSLMDQGKIETSKIRSKMLEVKLDILRIYSKKDAKFDGKIVLICSMTFVIEEAFSRNNLRMLNGFPIENHIRSGNFFKGDPSDMLLKTFLFYQFNYRDSKDYKIDYFDHANTRILTIHPPNNILNLEEFSKYIMDVAIGSCN